MKAPKMDDDTLKRIQRLEEQNNRIIGTLITTHGALVDIQHLILHPDSPVAKQRWSATFENITKEIDALIESMNSHAHPAQKKFSRLGEFNE